jgi:hypothetical protein
LVCNAYSCLHSKINDYITARLKEKIPPPWSIAA